MKYIYRYLWYELGRMISKQVEQAKLQLKKDTPVFSTIQEAIIPIKRSSPKRTQIVIIFGFVGVVFSCISILISSPLKKIFSEIKLKLLSIFKITVPNSLGGFEVSVIKTPPP